MTACIIQQCDSTGSPPDRSPYLPVPGLVISTSCGVGPLGIDHQLVEKRVFIYSGSSRKKLCPFFPISRNLLQHTPGDFCILFCFCLLQIDPPFLAKKKWEISKDFPLFFALFMFYRSGVLSALSRFFIRDSSNK